MCNVLQIDLQVHSLEFPPPECHISPHATDTHRQHPYLSVNRTADLGAVPEYVAYVSSLEYFHMYHKRATGSYVKVAFLGAHNPLRIHGFCP